MARANKYSSVNFNDIYEKKIPTTPSPSSTSFSSRLSNGGMLVLSRPSPKPTSSLVTTPPPPSKSPSSHTPSLLSPETSPSPENQEREIQQPSPVPKSDKFVPPHLRPGYVARDQTHAPPESFRPGGSYRPGSGQGLPSSGGGYDRRMREVGAPSGESDLVDFSRPRSGGFRPNSSG